MVCRVSLAHGGSPRGRPARIGRPDIVRAALHLGLDAVSMQGIAEHLGVTTPALYSHVSGRAEVVELAATELRGRLRTFASAADDWRGWLEDFAALVRRHLATSAATLIDGLRGPELSSRVGIGERGLQLLIDEGLTPTEAGYAVWLVFRVAITAGPAREAPPFAGLVDDTGAVLGPGAAGELPATAAVQRALAEDGPHDTFAFDLAAVLDGIAARVATAGRSR